MNRSFATGGTMRMPPNTTLMQQEEYLEQNSVGDEVFEFQASGNIVDDNINGGADYTSDNPKIAPLSLL